MSSAEGHLKLRIRKSKTDQYRQGDEVVLVESGSPTCPVSMLKRYMALGEVDRPSEAALFRPITRTRSRVTTESEKARIVIVLKSERASEGSPEEGRSRPFQVWSPQPEVRRGHSSCKRRSSYPIELLSGTDDGGLRMRRTVT